MLINLLLLAVFTMSSIVCFPGQSISTLSTNDEPNDALSPGRETNTRTISPTNPDSEPSLIVCQQGKPAVIGNDLNFRVPKTTFSVTIFPSETYIELDSLQVDECVRQMQRRLSSRRETEKITRTIVERFENVQLKLEPLLPPGCLGNIINYGEGGRVFEALYNFLDILELYEAFEYQVYNVTNFIAVGSLRPLKSPEMLPFTSSLPQPFSANPTPARTHIDR